MQAATNFEADAHRLVCVEIEGSYGRVTAFAKQWKADQLESQLCEHINTFVGYL